MHRAIALAGLAGARLLVFHLSCGESAREVALAKQAGTRGLGRGHLARPRVRRRRARDRRPARAVLRRATADPRRRAARRAVGGARPRGDRHRLLRPLPAGPARGLAPGRRVGDRDAPGAHAPLRRALRPDRPAALGRRLLPPPRRGSTASIARGGWSRGRTPTSCSSIPSREVELSAAALHSALPFSSYEGIVVRGFPVVDDQPRRGDRGRLASSSGRPGGGSSSSAAGRTGNLREAVGRSATLARRGSAVRVSVRAI